MVMMITKNMSQLLYILASYSQLYLDNQHSWKTTPAKLTSQLVLMRLSLSIPTYPRSGNGWGLAAIQHNLSPARVGAFGHEFSLFLESLYKIQLGDLQHKIVPRNGEFVKRLYLAASARARAVARSSWKNLKQTKESVTSTYYSSLMINYTTPL